MKKIILLIGLFPTILLAEQNENLDLIFEKNCQGTESCQEEIPKKDKNFVLEIGEDSSFTIDLKVSNPKKQMINSVRAKIKFDPKKVEILDLEDKDSDFPLAAPGENNIDVDSGTVKVGRSLIGASKNSEEFLIVTISGKLKSTSADLEFINFQETELGDTGIFFAQGIDIKNILSANPDKIIIKKKQNELPVVKNETEDISKNNEKHESPEELKNLENAEEVDLPKSQMEKSVEDNKNDDQVLRGLETFRPENVMVKTEEDGKTTIFFPLPDRNDIEGFYVYYGQQSGTYSRRRDIGKNNFVVFENLPNGKKYYFAVTAYFKDENESDYSDEVSVVIGTLDTESHGFYGDPHDADPELIAKIKANSKVGPDKIFFLSLIVIGILMIFWPMLRQKKYFY